MLKEPARLQTTAIDLLTGIGQQFPVACPIFFKTPASRAFFAQQVARLTLTSLEAIIKALNENNVRYLIVGGLAVAAHGYGRFKPEGKKTERMCATCV